jgi:hypothetical protein
MMRINFELKRFRPKLKAQLEFENRKLALSFQV